MARKVLDYASNELYLGPLLGNGAPYSRMGIVELKLFINILSPIWTELGVIYLIPYEINPSDNMEWCPFKLKGKKGSVLFLFI